MNEFLDILRKKIVVFDGATGTHLQSQNLTPDDFGGEALAGCNEILVDTKPSAVEKVHRDYLEAGCDVIETDTFGGTSIVLAEYGLQKRAHELNVKAARIARRMADQFTTGAHRRFVAGSMGPTTKLPSLEHISFREMAAAYEEQADGLLEGGVDLLCVETSQDVLQAKAALYGIHAAFERLGRKVPLVVSVTVESVGTMLLGTEISAALTSIEPYNVDVFGLNCATGPKEMSEHVRTLVDSSPMPVFVMPNAGMPENVGGVAHYHLTPAEFVRSLSHFVRDLGVSVVGGCCGTTPEHIRQLVNAVGSLSPKPRKGEFTPSASSLYQSVPFSIDNPPVLVGERTNANGSKLFRDLLAKDDWEGIVAMGKEQAKEQAHMLDLCTAFVGRKEAADMREVVPRFNRQITIPLVIDSTDPSVIEEALQRIGGKAVVNSINLEDGEERLAKVVRLCRRYGAAVIALVIDEQGMAKTADRKLAVARRIYDLAVTKYGMHPGDIIFDMLTFTLGSGDEEFRRAAVETLDGIRRARKEFPGTHSILGVSNISFGLSPGVRSVLNSVFLHYAVEAGLDMAIVHASKIQPLFRIDETRRELARRLVFDERKFDGERCVSDPLVELMNAAGSKPSAPVASVAEHVGVEERLKRRIVDGNRVGLDADLTEALAKYPALEIVNTILLGGMKVVGELFGAGQMQLPFVLQSAEVMKAAVAFLEPHMDKSNEGGRGTLVIATVKGDVHDIGKNLVDIILTNNGYKVVNLGIKCPVETMLHAAKEANADAIGMSGLLVKSTLVMKENLEVMNEQEIRLPVILGGAALTRRYVEEELRSVYNGPVFYANDAFDGLHLMEKIRSGEALSEKKESGGTPDESEENLTGAEAKIAMSREEEKQIPHRSKVRTDVPVPVPPFWGTRVVPSVPLDEVYSYINETALFRGQWHVKRGKKSEEEFRALVNEKIVPDYEAVKKKARDERLLQPAVVYGYFPCQSSGNDLIVYKAPEGAPAAGGFDARTLTERVRFTFPRQTNDRFLCLSDFFASVESGRVDVVAFQMVTMGAAASEYSKRLFDSNEYRDYLYFHGLSVESAEALAEMWHKRVRTELGIAGRDASEVKKLFSQGYQGARYSFGYPACPNLEDHTKLFALLDPGQIGVRMTDEFMLMPEQSTDAIVVHHPDARYFTVT